MPIFRGELYFVELGPNRGRELNDKRRPVVVVSIPFINLKPLVIAIVPGKTHKPGKPIYKNQVLVDPSPDNGLQASTLFDCAQIKALDHGRFDRPVVGHLTADQLSEIEKALKWCLGLV
jgi:mRNA interferase MazF